MPTYSAQNQFLSIPSVSTPYYDKNGNLIKDNLNTYTWDPNWGTMLTVSTGSTTVTAIYDAFGRMVENNAGGTNTEFVYGPTGARLAKVNGTTLVKAFIALPGGAKAIYNSTGLAYYRHPDWLGSSRLTSTPSRTLYSGSAYAPYGEQYSTSGTADASFTGQDQDTVSSLYDFWFRRYSPSQGRWISPDPLGRTAATLTTPQSWNRYAYVGNNPLSSVDPLGLFCLVGNCDGGGPDPGPGEGGGSDSCFYEGMFCGGYPPDPPISPPTGSGDGGGSNSGNCYAACQQAIQDAAQAAQNALNDPGCAQAVAGGSQETLAAANGVDPLETIGTADLGPPTLLGGGGVVELIAQTTGTVNCCRTQDQFSLLMPLPYIGPPFSITINSFPGQGLPTLFQTFGQPGYGPFATQTIVMLHEDGHVAEGNNLPSVVQPDGNSSDQSMQNSEAVASACLPQGDSGGNQGPVDQPPGDIPAVRRGLGHVW